MKKTDIKNSFPEKFHKIKKENKKKHIFTG